MPRKKVEKRLQIVEEGVLFSCGCGHKFFRKISDCVKVNQVYYPDHFEHIVSTTCPCDKEIHYESYVL